MVEPRSEETVLRPHPAIRTVLLTRGEVRAVVLDERSGTPHILDSAAAAVWALLDEPRRSRELVDELVATFGVELDDAAVAVSRAVRSFSQLGMLDDTGDSPWRGDRPRPQAEEVRPLPREHDP